MDSNCSYNQQVECHSCLSDSADSYETENGEWNDAPIDRNSLSRALQSNAILGLDCLHGSLRRKMVAAMTPSPWEDEEEELSPEERMLERRLIRDRERVTQKKGRVEWENKLVELKEKECLDKTISEEELKTLVGENHNLLIPASQLDASVRKSLLPVAHPWDDDDDGLSIEELLLSRHVDWCR